MCIRDRFFAFLSTSAMVAPAWCQDPVVEPPSEDTDVDDEQKSESQPVSDAPSVLVKPAEPKAAAKPPADAGPFAKGRVFLDANEDGKFNDGDQPFESVRVSNGKEIVQTDNKGMWKLPLEEDAIFFIIKPSGFQSKLSENNLPRFYYIHKPNGSPKLRFPGSKPTGALPESIDFPLYPSNEPEDFQMLLFGDPQPRNNQEVDYIAHDVIAQLIGNLSLIHI